MSAITELRQVLELLSASGLNPDRLYDAEEAAAILGYKGNRATDRVYEIPGDELVRTRLGPRGGTVRFRGRDLLAFLDARRDG